MSFCYWFLFIYLFNFIYLFFIYSLCIFETCNLFNTGLPLKTLIYCTFNFQLILSLVNFVRGSCNLSLHDKDTRGVKWVKPTNLIWPCRLLQKKNLVPRPKNWNRGNSGLYGPLAWRRLFYLQVEFFLNIFQAVVLSYKRSYDKALITCRSGRISTPAVFWDWIRTLTSCPLETGKMKARWSYK